jgi:hypothetical protein
VTSQKLLHVKQVASKAGRRRYDIVKRKEAKGNEKQETRQPKI